MAAQQFLFSQRYRCSYGETTWPTSARVRAPRTTGPFSQRYHDPRERLRGAVPRSGSASLAKQLDRRPDRLALQYKTPPEGHEGSIPSHTQRPYINRPASQYETPPEQAGQPTRRPRFQLPRSNDRVPACGHGRQANSDYS